MKEALAFGVGKLSEVGRSNEHEVALIKPREEFDHVSIREPHTAVRDGPSDQSFVVGAVEIDITFERVAARPAIDAILQSFKREDASKDQVFVARLSAPSLRGRLARDEHRAGRCILTDPLMDAMPARRRAVGAFGAANAIA